MYFLWFLKYYLAKYKELKYIVIFVTVIILIFSYYIRKPHHQSDPGSQTLRSSMLKLHHLSKQLLMHLSMLLHSHLRIPLWERCLPPLFENTVHLFCDDKKINFVYFTTLTNLISQSEKMFIIWRKVSKFFLDSFFSLQRFDINTKHFCNRVQGGEILLTTFLK